MNDNYRRYWAWVAGFPMSHPDRNFLIGKFIGYDDEGNYPRNRSYNSRGADGRTEDGERVTLLYWYGTPGMLDEEAVEEHDCRVLVTGVDSPPDIPEEEKITL